MNKKLATLIFAVSVIANVYSEESETPYTDMMLKRLFALRLEIDKEYEKKWLVPDRKHYYLSRFIMKSLQGHEWGIRPEFSCEQGYTAFTLGEYTHLESSDVSLEGEGRKSRTNEGKILAEKANDESTIMDKRMKCMQKRGCLLCLMVVPTEEFEEKFAQFVKEQKEQDSASSS